MQRDASNWHSDLPDGQKGFAREKPVQPLREKDSASR
jgi:hypothetical protein